MSEDTHKYHLLSQLICDMLSGRINDSQREQLRKLIAEDSDARNYYIDYMTTWALLDEYYGADSEETIKDFDSELWQSILEDEKYAPAVIIKKPKQKTIVPAGQDIVVKRVNKASLITAVLAVAALLFVLIFVKLNPVITGREVAMVVDSIDAKWADISTIQNGTHLSTAAGSMYLSKGIVKLQFNSNATVVLEAPTEFELLTENQIALHYGRLYATVPHEALGFTVTTSNSKIIDLGTEFGVETTFDNTTELHVLQGKTTLVSGNKDKTTLLVSAGQAKKVSGLTASISDVSFNKNKFAREIDSRRHFIWRGENISLASIVAGRDGFQEVGSLIGLNPVNGKYTASVIQKNRNSNGTYNLVTGSDFIDGVFVPDGESGTIQITSLGHTFDCPDTSGIFTHEIAAYKGPIKNQHTTIPPVIINGQEVVNDSVLMLHSNTGITFDLQAIRNSLPLLDLKNFNATGVPMKEFNPDIYFWVLVDGQLKYEKKIVTVDRDPISLNIEFGPQDRFLTLIVTDGLRGTGDERKDPFSSDFFYLINPELNLKEGQ